MARKSVVELADEDGVLPDDYSTELATVDGEDAMKVEVADEVVGPGAYPSRQTELMGLLSELERIVHVNAVSFGEEDRMHTGSFCLDLVMGGGLAPGWYTFSGVEQSTKTTAAISIAAASVDQKVDLRVLWDAENSSGNSLPYIANIMKTNGVQGATVETIFGVRNSKGEYEIPPTVYYRDDYEGQKFFNWFYGALKRLPDKRYSAGRWWYVWDDETDMMKTKAKIKAMGYQIDVGMTSKNPGIWVPAPDGGLQMIMILDSIPALLPPTMDDDGASNSIGQLARMYSKEIPRVKGMFRAKRVAMVAINQIRMNPMARFGNPETEAGGHAVAYYSDCRFKFFPNALSSAPFPAKGEGKFEEEPSVCGTGRDVYRYISVTTVKNKLSTPGRDKTWLRLWVEDKDGQGRGYDPVFDMFYFLWQTGQATGGRTKIALNIQRLGPAKTTISWMEFKVLVLGTKSQKIEIFKKLGYKPVNLRTGITDQIASGRAHDMAIAQASKVRQLKASAVLKLNAPEAPSTDNL